MGRKEYEKVTAMQSNPSKNVRMIASTSAAVLAATTGSERLAIYAPIGKVAKLINLVIMFPAVAAATSGSKRITIDLDAGGGSGVGVCYTEGVFNLQTAIMHGAPSGDTANLSRPNDISAFQSQVANIEFDEFVGMQIYFQNFSNGATVAGEIRVYRIFVTETKIS